MARTTTATFDTANALSSNSPVAIIEVNGVTRRFVSGTWNDITPANDKKYIKSLTLKFPEIDFSALRTGVSQANFTLIDENEEVLDVLNTDNIMNTDVTIKIGYQSLDEADFVTIPDYKVTGDLGYSPGAGEWSFIAKDVVRRLDNKIFRAAAETTLTATLARSGTTVTVADQSDFSAFGVIEIEDELIRYDSLTGTTQFNVVGANQRGHGNTVDVQHLIGKTVRQFYTSMALTTPATGGTGLYALFDPLSVFSGVGFSILPILLTTDAGGGGIFDLGIEGYGLGLTSAEVDIDSFLVESYFWGDSLSLWGSSKSVNAVDFIQENFLRPTGHYLYTNGDGKIALGRFDLFTFSELFSSDGSIAENDFAGMPTYEIDADNLINRVEFNTSPYNVLSGTPNGPGVSMFDLDASVTEYSASDKKLVISNPDGVPSSAVSANMIASRYLYLLGNPLVKVNMPLHHNLWTQQVGDFLQVTHPNLPDVPGNSIGWTDERVFATGQQITVFSGSDNAIVSVQGIAWESYQQVSGFFTVEQVESGGIDDTTLSLSSDVTTTLEAADAYVDFSPVETNIDLIMVRLVITPPGTSGTDAYFKLQLNAENPSGTSLAFSQHVIMYDPVDSTAFNVDIMMRDITSSISVERVHIHYYEASTGAGADEATIAFNQVRLITLNNSITAS